MNVATLGFDEDLRELMQWVDRSSQHSLEACFDLPQSAEIRSLAGSAVIDESWEALLSTSVADVVLVASRPLDARGSERRNEQLRKLVQAAIPLVLVHPACEMLIGLELEMIRQDSQCLMIPYHAGLWDGHYRQLAGVVQRAGSADGPWGKIEQLVWERRASQRSDATVMKHFARDAMMLRDLMTNVAQVSATGAVAEQQRYANLSVNLTNQSHLIARWSIVPAQQNDGAQLTVIGSAGSARLDMPADAPFALSGTFSAPAPGESHHPAQQLFQRVEGLLSSPVASQDSPPWDASCRALEIEEAVERSCRRGRTIELFHEKVTERETFMSMMAAGGCAMLLWVLLMLLIAGVVEGLKLPIRESNFWRLWSMVLVAPLAIFLLLQLLLSREKGGDA